MPPKNKYQLSIFDLQAQQYEAKQLKQAELLLKQLRGQNMSTNDIYNAMANNLYGPVTGTQTAPQSIGVAYPGVQGTYPYIPTVLTGQANPPPIPMTKDTLNFFITPIANGFLVYLGGQDISQAKYCGNTEEIQTAIIALMAFKKLTSKD